MKFDITCIIPSSKTDSRMVAFEENVAPQSGPPLHAHRKQWEVFHIIDGEFLFQLDGEQVALRTGGSIVIPPAAPHTFKNVGSETGTIHFELLDAGKSEEFFRRLVAEIGSISDVGAFFAEYDIDLLGPPL